MANLRIKGDVSGYVDLVSPDVAGTQTINLDRLVETNANGQITVSTDTEHQLTVQSATSGAGGSLKVASSGAYAYNVVQNANREWRYGLLGGSGFTITDWSGGPAERLVIDNSGNIGIGTTNPGYKLHVNGDFYSSGNINTANAVIALGTGASGGLRLHTNSGVTASNNYMNFFTSQTNGWAFNFNGTGADTDRKLSINPDGDIILSGSIYWGSRESIGRVDQGNTGSLAISYGIQKFDFQIPSDNAWYNVITNFRECTGYMWTTVSDASSRRKKVYEFNRTSPAYGVSTFSLVHDHGGGWNTGDFNFQVVSDGSSSFILQCQRSSYYNSANISNGRITILLF